MIDSRIELVTGVCPVLYYPEDHQKVLVVRELTAKRQTGKLAGMWGLGYETVEPGEDHRAAINRFFLEEVKIVDGTVFIPDNLEESKLCVIRISPPEIAAWLHVYACPVSEDLIVSNGSFQQEVQFPLWMDVDRILRAESNSNRILFRAGTYEIVKSFLAKLNLGKNFVPQEYFDPINIPPVEIYNLMEQGLSQSEALCRLGIDPTQLEQSHYLIHSL